MQGSRTHINDQVMCVHIMYIVYTYIYIYKLYIYIYVIIARSVVQPSRALAGLFVWQGADAMREYTYAGKRSRMGSILGFRVFRV